ncbi:MAG: hypothetical protein ABR605_07440, partial [Desulfurivibrionaceae bacterium]
QMDCGAAPDFSSAVDCNLAIQLGPAPVYNYHFEVRDSGGVVLTSSLNLEEPIIYLLNGPNMLGIARDLSGSDGAFQDNLGATDVFGWQSGGLRGDYNKGEFVPRDNSYTPIPGEGYFVIGDSENQTLSTSLNDNPEITDPSVTMDL